MQHGLRPTRLVALAAGCAALLAVPAVAASGGRPELGAPQVAGAAKAAGQPTSYTAAQPPAFTVKAPGGSGRVFVVVGRATGGEYGVRNVVMIREMRPVEGGPRMSAEPFAASGARPTDTWLSRPRTYFWTAVRVNCEDGGGKSRSQCLIAAPPRALEVVKAR